MSPRTAGAVSGDLPDLELECMKVLWVHGDLSVRTVQQQLQPRRPLAYTTVLTVLDRLARKGVVTRRKSGRLHLYHPVYTLAQAREKAVNRVLEHYFGASRELLLQHLGQPGAPAPAVRATDEAPAPSLDTTLL